MSTNDDLPPLPVGQKMGSATINGRYIEIRMHDDNAMQAYAREAVAADRVRVEQGKSMNLHDQIMNILAAPNELTMALYIGDTALAYKIGHRDARHAASELVLAAAPLPKEQT